MPYKEINGLKSYSYLTAAEAAAWGRKKLNSPGILTTPADLKRKGKSGSLPVRTATQKDAPEIK